MMRRVAFFACVFFAISQQYLVAQEIRSLNDIFLDLDDASESVARNIADLQAKGQWKMDQGPLYKSTPPKENRDPNIATDDLIFEGYFQPVSDQTNLAIFSDDGCDVWINSVLVLNNFKKPQHLPTLQQSFHVLKAFKPIAGQLYQIKIRYANTIYLGKTDIDGCTLFAFNGGGNGIGKPVIKRKKDGEKEYKNIDEKNNNVLPGELMELKAELVGGEVQKNVEWILPGKIFADYKPNENQAVLKKDVDKTKNPVNFYWADSGDGRELICKMMVGGKTISGKATINVKKPEVTFFGVLVPFYLGNFRVVSP